MAGWLALGGPMVVAMNNGQVCNIILRLQRPISWTQARNSTQVVDGGGFF